MADKNFDKIIIFSYKVLPIKRDEGIIQFVTNAETVSSILKKYNDSKNSIKKYLEEIANRFNRDLSEIIDNYKKSLGKQKNLSFS